MNDEFNMLEHALKYADMGFYILPLHYPVFNESIVTCSCTKDDCDKSIGKHPIISGGFKSASNNNEQIKTWWQQNPQANIGIATGKISNLVVIDLDCGRDLPPAFPPINSNITVKTAKGFHFYFNYPEGLAIKSPSKLLGYDIDIRGDGGYIIAPPSKHQNGGRYEFIVE